MVVADGLSGAEQQVWNAFPAGRLVDLGTGNDADDDPERGSEWGEARQVSADVLLALLCGQVDVPAGQSGRIWLRNARIIGKISFQNGELRYPLSLEQCYIGDGISLEDATIPALSLVNCHIGPVNLRRTKVNGTVDLAGTLAEGGDGPAMIATGLVTRALRCGLGFHAVGKVTLDGASIGDLLFSGAYLDGNGDNALEADGVTVTGTMHCDEVSTTPKPGQEQRPEPGQEGRFRTRGEIWLRGANVGELNLRGAQLNGNGGYALRADQITVTRTMYCDQGFYAEGGISIAGASLRQLSLRGARLTSFKQPQARSDHPAALNAQDLTVTFEMICDSHRNERPVADQAFSADGAVILSGAKVAHLIDDKPSWPEHIDLFGLTYGELNQDIPVDDRLDWLRNAHHPHEPQPYQQLASIYRGLGYDDSARRVLLENQRLRRRQRPRRWRLWGWVQDGIAGYGYAPGRAVVLLAAAFVAGWLVFRSYPPTPVDPTAHLAFNAPVYTLDVLIPTQVFGQIGNWDPHGLAFWAALGLRVFGWVLAITVAAAIGRVFTRSQ
jgi:hypothetical protein